MKKFSLLCFSMLFSFQMFAQAELATKALKLKKISLSTGVDLDMVNNLDYEYLRSTGIGADASLVGDLEFDQSSVYGGVCENPHIRLGLVFDMARQKNMELNVNAVGIFNRVDGVYLHTDRMTDEFFNRDFDFASFNSYTNEIAIETSINKRANLGRFIKLYAGLGTNLGYSFNGHLSVNGNADQVSVDQNFNRAITDIAVGSSFQDYTYSSYKVKNGIHQRAFAEVGVGFVLLKRVELGFDYRYGVGYRALFDGPTRMTRLSSYGVKASFILPQK